MTDHKKLRELAEKATPGPWKFDGYDVYQLTDSGQGYPLDRYPDSADIVIPQCEACGNRIPFDDKNAAFIAAASPDVLIALLDHIAALEAARDEACDELERWVSVDSVPTMTPAEARARIRTLRNVGRKES